MTQAEDDLAEIKARMNASKLRDSGRFAERMVRARAVPVRAEPIPGTREFSLEQVGPGWRLLSADRRFAGTGDEFLGAEPIEGVCVEVIHDRLEDAETGEIIERTRYRCLTTWRPQHPWQMLGAEEIDLGQLAGYDRQSATVAVRWLLRPVAAGKHKWLTASEIEAIHDAWRLTAAIR